MNFKMLKNLSGSNTGIRYKIQDVRKQVQESQQAFGTKTWEA